MTPRHGHPIVLAGANESVLLALEAHRPDLAVHVVEDPELWPCRSRRVAGRANVSSVSLAGLAESGPIAELARLTGAVAVVPGVEDAVRAATAAAAELALPSLGPGAAVRLTDKAELRAAARQAGLAQPDFAVFDSAHDVPPEWPGPAVLKPVDLSGSAGVAVVRDSRGWPQARRELVRALTGSGRDPARSRVLVEDVIEGPEVSTEVLVESGKVRFVNVTAKTVSPGMHPVEVGHAVPAALDPAATRGLSEAVDRLVASLGVGSGLLHAEWILARGAPWLVECAGRPPGDFICRLIEDAYGWSLLAEGLVAVLAGAPVDPPSRALSGAAVEYVRARPGVVREVTGLDPVRSSPGVAAAEVWAVPGDAVGPLRSSGDRCGYVRTVARSATVAQALARQRASEIRVETAVDA